MNRQLDRGYVPYLPSRPFAFATHFIKVYWIPLVAMVILEAGQAACQILIPDAVRTMIDTVSGFSGTFEEGLSLLEDPLTYFVLLSLGILFFSRGSGAILVLTGPLLRRRVRLKLYHYLQYHSHRFFIGNFAGSLANRISEVATGVNHSLWTVMFDFLPVIVSFSVSMHLLASASSQLAWFLGVWIFFYVGISFVLAQRCRKYAKTFAAARSQVTGKVVDAVTNVMNTKLFAKLDYERENLCVHLDHEVKTAKTTFWFMEKMRWFQFVFALLLQVGIMILALRLWLAKEISVGSFAMVTSLALLVINEARGLSRRFLEFFEYMGNISDGVGIIVKPHEILDKDGAKDLVVTRGQIEFDQVSFAYTSGTPVFTGLNVRIAAGEKVGLVGFSGSGKTSFANLILRMFDVQSGEIRIDSQNIVSHTQDSLRKQISMIPQEPMLFHRSLLENIRYGQLDASDEAVFAAAQKARAHEFILRLPEKYEALVGERGVKLSGGQRQRIAIARAFLKNAPILVMDEATSSLDSVTEESIQLALEEIMVDRTVVVIAHRLSTIARLDRILVFDQGKIIEQGTHQDLIELNGHYAKMWHRQAGGFLPTRRQTGAEAF